MIECPINSIFQGAKNVTNYWRTNVGTLNSAVNASEEGQIVKRIWLERLVVITNEIFKGSFAASETGQRHTK